MHGAHPVAGERAGPAHAGARGAWWRERTRDLVAARDELEQLASVDALTGVANRRIFDATLDREWKRAQRGGHWLSVVLLDVDFFKRYNDRYGHGARRRLPARGRAGGRRAVPPPDRPGRALRRRGVRARAAGDGSGGRAADACAPCWPRWTASAIAHADSGCAPHVTVSLGAVSLKPAADGDAASALARADRLLYVAKEGGRHQARHDDGGGEAVIAP